MSVLIPPQRYLKCDYLLVSARSFFSCITFWVGAVMMLVCESHYTTTIDDNHNKFLRTLRSVWAEHKRDVDRLQKIATTMANDITCHHTCMCLLKIPGRSTKNLRKKLTSSNYIFTPHHCGAVASCCFKARVVGACEDNRHIIKLQSSFSQPERGENHLPMIPRQGMIKNLPMHCYKLLNKRMNRKRVKRQ